MRGNGSGRMTGREKQRDGRMRGTEGRKKERARERKNEMEKGSEA